MIADDLDAWTKPSLTFCYEDAFSEAFLDRLHDSFRSWDDLHEVGDLGAVTAALADGSAGEIATAYGDLEFSTWVKQPGKAPRHGFAELSTTALASDIDGDAFFEYVLGLYERSVEAGRRPIYAIVAPDSGKYVVPPFTEESIRSGEIYALGWIHVFTPEQVERFGRERLVSAPATRIEILDDGSSALATALGNRTQEDAVADHLGIEAPVGEDWFDDLDHAVDYVRHRAARRIRSRVRDGAVSERRVLDHLDAEDPRVRFRLVKALHYSDDEAVVTTLRQLADADTSESVRSAAINALGDDPVARDALWDPSPKVQLSGLRSLRRCPDQNALRRVVDLLDSEYFQTRRKAAERLLSDRFFDRLPEGSMEEARRVLADCTDHDDDVVREHALEAAEAIEPLDYDERLAVMLGDESARVSLAAAERYVDIHDDADPAIDALLSIVDADAVFADDAATTLASIDPRRALVELLPRVGSLERSTQRSVIRTLDSIVEERGTRWTLDALDELDPDDRQAAASTLSETKQGDGLERLLDRR